MTNSIILDLDEFIEPGGIIRVCGAEYALRKWNQMSLIEQHQNRKRWQRIIEIEGASGDMTKKMATEHAETLRTLVCAISDMPAEIAEQTDTEQLGRAALGFFAMRSRLTTEWNERMLKMLSPSIGASSSPDSTPDGPENEPKHG